MCAAFTFEVIEEELNILTDELLNTGVFGNEEKIPDTLNMAYNLIGEISDIMDNSDTDPPSPEDQEKINTYLNTITNHIRDYIDNKCKSLKNKSEKKITAIQKFLDLYDKGRKKWDHSLTTKLEKIERELKETKKNKKVNFEPRKKMQTILEYEPNEIKWFMGGPVPNASRDKYFLYSGNPDVTKQKIRVYNNKIDAINYLNRLNNPNYEETEEEKRITECVLDEIERLIDINFDEDRRVTERVLDEMERLMLEFL